MIEVVRVKFGYFKNDKKNGKFKEIVFSLKQTWVITFSVDEVYENDKLISFKDNLDI